MLRRKKLDHTEATGTTEYTTNALKSHRRPYVMPVELRPVDTVKDRALTQ